MPVVYRYARTSRISWNSKGPAFEEVDFDVSDNPNPNVRAHKGHCSLAAIFGVWTGSIIFLCIDYSTDTKMRLVGELVPGERDDGPLTFAFRWVLVILALVGRTFRIRLLSLIVVAASLFLLIAILASQRHHDWTLDRTLPWLTACFALPLAIASEALAVGPAVRSKET